MIDMDSCSTIHVKLPSLSYRIPDAISCCHHHLKLVRLVSFNDRIRRNLWASLISTLVEDQLTIRWRKYSKFQSASGDIEENILLFDHLWGAIRERCREGTQLLNIG